MPTGNNMGTTMSRDAKVRQSGPRVSEIMPQSQWNCPYPSRHSTSPSPPPEHSPPSQWLFTVCTWGAKGQVPAFRGCLLVPGKLAKGCHGSSFTTLGDNFILISEMRIGCWENTYLVQDLIMSQGFRGTWFREGVHFRKTKWKEGSRGGMGKSQQNLGWGQI